MGEVRDRRIGSEWNLLAEVARANPDIVEVCRRGRRGDSDFFEVTLRKTGALVGRPPNLETASSHTALFRFAEYFPAVPIEVFMIPSVFHPNVHPENGFVCLWSHSSAGDTIATAIQRLQAVISWRLVNTEADHMLDPEALKWSPSVALPLPCEIVQIPEATQMEQSYRGPAKVRRRLSDPD